MNEDMKRLIEVYGDPANPDPLDPTLAIWLEESDWGQNLKHPLVYSMFYAPHMNRFVNRQLEAKLKAVKRAEEEREWSQYILLHERPWRQWAFKKIAKKLTNEEYWEVFREVLIDTENMWQWKKDLRRLFNRPNRHLIMDEYEREMVRTAGGENDNFPLIYRGYTYSKEKLGWSWTLDWGTAEWFAQRFASVAKKKPMVAVGRVDRDKVLAYFESRGEWEVIVDPKTIEIVKVYEASEGDNRRGQHIIKEVG